MCKHDLSLDPYDTARIWEALLEDWKQNKDPAMDERILRMLEHYKSEDLRSAAIGDTDPCDASLPGLPLATEMGFSDFYGGSL